MITNINEALGFLNENRLENCEYITIYCGNNLSDNISLESYYDSENRAMIDIYIGSEKPYTPHLYIDGQYSGVYWNYIEDLFYHGCLVVDEVEYPFLFMEVVKND